MTALQPLLSLSDVTVTFGGASAWSRVTGLGRAEPHRAVDGVSLEVRPGSALGIVGESGSGKTTLMRAVMGLVAPSAGTIAYAGAPLGTRRSIDQRRAIQMVFQDPGTTLSPTHTVRAALAEALRVHRVVSRSDTEARVHELLDLVHLPRRVADAKPSELSGGQKQRVAIARALAVKPDLLIADEATSALDVVVQAAVLDLLAELRRETGITLIAVTHDLDLVRYLCDDVAVLQHGRLVEAGPVASVLDAPTDEYTRTLIAAAPRLRHLEEAS